MTLGNSFYSKATFLFFKTLLLFFIISENLPYQLELNRFLTRKQTSLSKSGTIFLKLRFSQFPQMQHEDGTYTSADYSAVQRVIKKDAAFSKIF